MMMAGVDFTIQKNDGRQRTILWRDRPWRHRRGKIEQCSKLSGKRTEALVLAFSVFVFLKVHWQLENDS